MSEPVFRRIVQTDCHECFIDVEGVGGQWRWIGVSLLSTHVDWWSHYWRSRVRNAWDVLRGRRGVPVVELDTAESAGALISALMRARDEAFKPMPGAVDE